MTMTDSSYQITIDVSTAYVEEQSDPSENRYVFSYTIRLHNTGAVAAKLLTRHWIITDADGNNQEVHGAGVIGVQPYLRPGERFEYTSGTILDTPVGSMRGSYQLLADDNHMFDAPIPPFTLSVPRILH